MSITTTIYLSSKQPYVFKHITQATASIQYNDTLKAFIVPLTNYTRQVENIVEVNLLRYSSNYIKSIWEKESKSIAWERTLTTHNLPPLTNDEEGNPIPNIEKTFYPSITLSYFHPSHLYTPNPYWASTTLEIQNPMLLSPNVAYIIKSHRDSETITKDFADFTDKSDYWYLDLSNEVQKHIETQVAVRPGEYIQLKWECNVGDNNAGNIESDDRVNYTTIIDSVKFETPLFTGGQIIAKYGTGVNTRYSVKIFDEEFHNIMPTDFFDYKVGKWCYLMKVNARLTGEHQEYGSSQITNSSNANEADYLLLLVNRARNEAGLDALVVNNYLLKSSYNHAEDMSIHQYFSHTGLDGSTASDRIIDAGYLANITYEVSYYLGENIATGASNISLDRIFAAWMNSPGHRENILNPIYTETGISLSTIRNNDIYYVQNFGYRSDGINVGIEANYRITPFNFGGNIYYENEMAISYENDLYIDMSNDFEKIFDMTQYIGTITNIDYKTDTALVNIPIVNPSTGLIEQQAFTLPIFFHCNEQPITQGGSTAFQSTNSVLIEKPKSDENFDNAYIIAHHNNLQQCKKGVLFVFKSNDWEELFYIYFIWDFIINDYITTPARLNIPEEDIWDEAKVDDFICNMFFNNDMSLMYDEVIDITTLNRTTSTTYRKSGYVQHPIRRIISWTNLDSNIINNVDYTYNSWDGYNGYQDIITGSGTGSSHFIQLTYYTAKNRLFSNSGYPKYRPPIYWSQMDIYYANWYESDKNRVLSFFGSNPYIVSYDIYTNKYLPPSSDTIESVTDIFPVGKYAKYYENYRTSFDSMVVNSLTAIFNNILFLEDDSTVTDTWTITFIDDYGNFNASGLLTGDIGSGNLLDGFFPINPNSDLGLYYFGILASSFTGLFFTNESFSFKTYGIRYGKGYIGAENNGSIKTIYNTVANDIFEESISYSPIHSIKIDGIYDNNQIIWVYWKCKEDYYEHEQIIGYSGSYDNTSIILPKDVPINTNLTQALESVVAMLGNEAGYGRLRNIIKL